MPKHQTGLRVDRILFKQFQQLCAMEKLRLGEAAESLIRAALEAKTIAGFQVQQPNQENTVRMFDVALFKSLLSRLKTALELEQKVWKETRREEADDEKESVHLMEALTELGRRNINPELIREFETIISESDKLYAERRRFYAEEEVCDHKTGT